MFEFLPFDVKLTISRGCYQAWQWMAVFDPEFMRYARSAAGIAECIKQFAVTSTGDARPKTTKTFLFDQLHRIYDQPAVVIHYSGVQKWYYAGKLHRENGPAEISGCARRWFRHGNYHRESGPITVYRMIDIDYVWLCRWSDCTCGYYRKGSWTDAGGNKTTVPTPEYEPDKDPGWL